MTSTKQDTRKALRLANGLTAELQRMEHRAADQIDGFDATDELTQIRAALGYAIEAEERLLELE